MSYLNVNGISINDDLTLRFLNSSSVVIAGCGYEEAINESVVLFCVDLVHTPVTRLNLGENISSAFKPNPSSKPGLKFFVNAKPGVSTEIPTFK